MATIHEPLVCSILNHDIEAALYETGHLLHSGDTVRLECSWIHVLSIAGEAVQVKDVPEYQRAIMHIHGIVSGEEIMVKDAFLATTRLLILCKKYTTLYAKPALAKIREKVLDMFPEGAMLNESGMETFKKVMPPDNVPEYAFIHRVLAGLTKLWGEKKYEESRISLEYLARKRFLSIPKPTWIAPHVRDDLDLIWVLWGAALLYFNSDIVSACYNLFVFQCKKQTKVERQGLLWSISYHAICSYKEDDEWNKEETKLYRQVESKTESLWEQVVGEQSVKDVCLAKDDPYFWTSYFPRVKESSLTAIPVYDFKEEVRTIKIRGSR